MKIIKWVVLFTIPIVVIVFCIGISKQANIEIKDKWIICISFLGLFATFLGAYLGAKISGDTSRKLLLHQLTINTFEAKFDKNVEFVNRSEELVDGVINQLESINYKLPKIAFTKSKDKNSETLLELYFKLKIVYYLLNDYDNECSKKNLKGNNISIQVLKNFEDTKGSINEICEVYKNIGYLINKNATSKWCKTNGKNSYKPNKMESNIYDIEGEEFIFSFVYYGVKQRISLPFSEAFKIDSEFFLAKEIHSAKMKFVKFEKIIRNRKFRNEQSIVDYINYLYSRLS